MKWFGVREVETGERGPAGRERRMGRGLGRLRAVGGHGGRGRGRGGWNRCATGVGRRAWVSPCTTGRGGTRPPRGRLPDGHIRTAGFRRRRGGGGSTRSG